MTATFAIYEVCEIVLLCWYIIEALKAKEVFSLAYSHMQVVASYFPLPQCIEGLKVLVESLFGAKFHSIPLAPGESWHPDVLKMSLHHPEEVFTWLIIGVNVWIRLWWCSSSVIHIYSLGSVYLLQGDLGYLYLDLYSRNNKYPGCAHFAIKGGRRVSDTEYQLPVCN